MEIRLLYVKRFARPPDASRVPDRHTPPAGILGDMRHLTVPRRSAHPPIVAVLVLGLLSACSSQLTDAEPPATDIATIEAGQSLYETHCSECHGTDLRGTDKGPSHLSAVYEPSHHADGAFLMAVLSGVRQHHWKFGDMEPISGLDPPEIAAITAYVRSVQEREGFEPYPP